MELATECGYFATYGCSPVALSSQIAKDLDHFSLTHEQTIRSVVTCKGVGLHSGAPVSLRILPAPAGSGIVFHRTDLDGFAIEASGRNV
ncbi:MAG: UDP-3-O-acyl-N-acetylglucosamine deacetylase, partial [Terriglobales bacterium]